MTMIHFKDSDLASESKLDCGLKIKLLTDMMNAAVQQFGILGKYLSRDDMTIKSYGHNSPRQFICEKPQIPWF
jgi:hypothetical protein